MTDVLSEQDTVGLEAARLSRPGIPGVFKEFVQAAWHVVEPGNEFIDGKHIDLVCSELQNWRSTRDLMVTIPPGCCKSLLVSVFFPAWVWTFLPDHRFIVSSFDAALTRRDALKSIDIMKSPWYQARWGGKFLLGTDPAASDFTNSQKGWRFSTSVGGKATGRHADTHIYDDLLKPLTISDATLDEARRYVRETMPTRFRDYSKGCRILIMQRLSELDPAGELLKDGTFKLLRLPMRAEKERCEGDWRTEEGQLLWPERFPESAVAHLERQIGGPRAIAAQLQQRPAPESGNLFQKAWFKRYTTLPKMDLTIQSWDLSFKDADDSDYVAAVLIGRCGVDYYLIDLLKQCLNFPATLAAFRAKAKDPVWGKASVKLVEDKANGPAVVSSLEKEIPGILAVTPEGGKVARANAVAPILECGHFYVPEFSAWAEEYLYEMCAFPFAAHDDTVDATTQGLHYFHINTTRFASAMARLRGDKNG